MRQELWREIVVPTGNEDRIWELFHENSKLSKHVVPPSPEHVRAKMKELVESLDFAGYPVVALPNGLAPLKMSLSEAISTRASALNINRCEVSLEDVATLLHSAYGVNRDNKNSAFPRPFRVVPSAGALYPLEVFFHASHVQDLRPGVYHYNPTKNHLRLLRDGDHAATLAPMLAQPEIARGASLIIFITALFERSIFKYGDRGYRFVYLEAGHMAQNINLVSNGLGLGCMNIGGFFDRQIDDFLTLDGVTHSVIYMVALGKQAQRE